MDNNPIIKAKSGYGRRAILWAWGLFGVDVAAESAGVAGNGADSSGEVD